MPAQYEAMRDAFIRQGLGEMAAKKKAARIYNSKHPGAPVTRSHTDTPGSGRFGLGNRDNRDKRDTSGGRDE